MKSSTKLGAVIAIFTIFGVTVTNTSANAATTQKNLVIIDTGYDATQTKYSSKVIYEKCVSSFATSCPNGTNAQEGAGSAALPSAVISKFSTSIHGTEMIASAEAVTGNTPIIFVRASSYTNSMFLLPSTQDLINILNWVYDNKDTLNIGAVSFSISNKLASCTNADLNAVLNKLKSANVMFATSAGNDSVRTGVYFPGCVKPAISVGSTDNNVVFSGYSNSGAGLDFAAIGTITATFYNKNVTLTGTSVATPIFAASWLAINSAKPYLTYDQEYALINSTKILTSNTYVKNVPTLNLAGALK
jgi:hypothetical protein